MYDVHFPDDDDAPACTCCRCRVPLPKYPRGFGVMLLCALLFVPFWLYMLVAELPSVLQAIFAAL